MFIMLEQIVVVVNGVSTWAGPRAFTTAPTCFKPTAFSSTALQAFQVTLTWDSVATTTAWQIFALPQGITSTCAYRSNRIGFL